MKEKTKQWFEASGHYKAIKETMDSILPIIKFAVTELPSEFWEALEKTLTDGEVSNRIGEIYEKHFTEEEICHLVDLYNDPVMRKFLDNRTEIDQEIHKSTEELARNILQDAMAKVQQLN